VRCAETVREKVRVRGRGVGKKGFTSYTYTLTFTGIGLPPTSNAHSPFFAQPWFFLNLSLALVIWLCNGKLSLDWKV